MSLRHFVFRHAADFLLRHFRFIDVMPAHYAIISFSTGFSLPTLSFTLLPLR